jgi:hypothetical protein
MAQTEKEYKDGRIKETEALFPQTEAILSSIGKVEEFEGWYAGKGWNVTVVKYKSFAPLVFQVYLSDKRFSIKAIRKGVSIQLREFTDYCGIDDIEKLLKDFVRIL